MMMVFTIGVMSLSILGYLNKTSKDRLHTAQQRTIKQWKDTCCVQPEKAENLGIETAERTNYAEKEIHETK